MINYTIQVILFQVLFLGVYDFFLSKETFFTKNRWYLLSTSLLSFVLPLVKIPILTKAVSKEYIVYLPEIVLSPEKVILQTNWYQSINYVDVLFKVGMLFFALLFLMKLIKIIHLIRKHQLIKKEAYTIVLIPNRTKAFSFFNYVFLGEAIPTSQQDKILAHELVHSQQKHSLDLLFFEILKIVMWFNPMIFLYQKRITLVHEYISDEIASKKTQKETYINNLLSSFFQVENIAFINQFYKETFIKKRIIMMTKNKSQKRNQLKYLMLIPALVSMLFYVACTESGYQGKIKIKDEFYLIKQNELGKTVGFNSKGEEVDVLSLLPESVVALNFENGKLVTEFSYPAPKISKFKTLTTFEESTEEISFMKINKAPTFPGCETGDKNCFSKSVQNHFLSNFDKGLPQSLGLDSGKKRVFIGFKIDKEGDVVDVQVRAPHSKIVQEVLRVMKALPKMTPGEHGGEKIAVKYAIPFTLVVD